MTMSGWGNGRQLVWLVAPVAGLIMAGVEKASKSVTEASNKNLDALKAEVAKQEIMLKFELLQAKIA